MKDISRRKMIGLSGLATGGILTAMPLNGLNAQDKKNKLKIIVVGAHPDDPETGCGGTMIRLAEQGHEVVSLYLTKGEGGIANTTHDKAAKIRTAEAEEACKIMKVRPVFAGQIDGDTEITSKQYKNIKNLIEREKPDLVFTHWPIDTHRDHRIASILTYDAWIELNRNFELYYYEVYTGEQTQNFNPTHYVDISSAENEKRKACFSHKSQNPQEIYDYHRRMSGFRGLEYNCEHAEAFISQIQSKNKGLF